MKFNNEVINFAHGLTTDIQTMFNRNYMHDESAFLDNWSPAKVGRGGFRKVGSSYVQRARNDCFNTLHDEFFLIRPKLRFHKNPRPSQVTALTNQPNRNLRGHKGYGGQESSSILFGLICFFPQEYPWLSVLFNSKIEDQDGDAQARLLARCSQ